MRALIVNYFFLYREFKLFGKQIKVVRAATPTVFAFFFGVLFQTLFSTGVFFTLVLWMPFFMAVYFGFFHHRIKPIVYDELEDWQQQWQYLHKPYTGRTDSTFPEGQELIEEGQRLSTMHHTHFKRNTVDLVVGVTPTLITLVGAALFVLLNNLI